MARAKCLEIAGSQYGYWVRSVGARRHAADGLVCRWRWRAAARRTRRSRGAGTPPPSSRGARRYSRPARDYTTTTLSAQPTSAATPSAFTTLSVSVSTTIKWGRPPNLNKRWLISKHNPVMFKAYPESKWSLLLIVWLVYLCLIRKQNFYNFDVIFCGIFAHSFHWLHENRVCNWSM